VHIAQADGVTCLAAVKAAFLGEDHTVVEAERIDDGGPYATRRRRADDDDAVAKNAQLTSITSNPGRFPEPARAPKPPAANTARSRSVRNLSQILSLIEPAPHSRLHAAAAPRQ